MLTNYAENVEVALALPMEGWEQPRMKLLELLDAIDFPLSDPPAWKRATSVFTSVNAEACSCRSP